MILPRSFYALLSASLLTTPLFAADPTPTPPTLVQQATSVTPATPETQAKIDLNKASVKELLKVKWINPSRARAIISYRKKHGNFKSVSELSKIKGFKKIKPEKMDTIQGQLTVE